MASTKHEEREGQVRALVQRMKECDSARSFCGYAFRGLASEARTLHIALGSAEVFGVVARPVEGREPHTAAQFVFFRADGVWTVSLAHATERDSDHRPFLERVDHLRLIPNEKIRALTVGSYSTVQWPSDPVNPDFTVHVDGVGDVLVTKYASADATIDGKETGKLFEHVRGLIAARR